MLQSNAKPAFLAACACHFLFAILGGIAIEAQQAVPAIIAMIGGALSLITACVLGVRILATYDSGKHSAWVKAALVFLVLGPLAYWGLQWPAMSDTVQVTAMIAVALGALFCSARAISVALDELAV